MKHKNKFCILFAGAMGSSKSPIANYLSIRLNLPILNNDTIRTEIREDLGRFDQDEYLRRRNERFEYLLKKEVSFIFDASIDRDWKWVKEELDKKEYKWFIISLNFSKELMKKIYEPKGCKDFEALDRTLKDHESFLKNYEGVVGINLNDADFHNRIERAYESILNWVKNFQRVR